MSDLIEFLRARWDEQAERAPSVHALDCELTMTAGFHGPCTCGVPDLLLREVEAKRQILADWQQACERRASLYDRPDSELHADQMHPDWEYATTEGRRKAWDDADTPPEGDGWERNTDAGRDGWERFDYTEESYWRRPLPEGKRGRREPEPPRHILLLALPFATHPDYRESWRP